MNNFERSNEMARQACGMPARTVPTICRRCDTVINAEFHSLNDCEATQQQQAIATDIALDRNKAERMTREAVNKGLQQQMDNFTGAYA